MKESHLNIQRVVPTVCLFISLIFLIAFTMWSALICSTHFSSFYSERQKQEYEEKDGRLVRQLIGCSKESCYFGTEEQFHCHRTQIPILKN